MRWLRYYTEALRDPKIQRLPPALFKHWVNLLCLAGELDHNGDLPCDSDIAFALRIKPSEAAKVMSSLGRAGLVDTTPDGRRFPHNWSQRQRKSDDIAARVALHREREAARNQASRTGGDTDVTLHETLHETGVLHSRALDPDPDTDTDTDTELLPVRRTRGSRAKAPADKGASAPQARTPTPSQPRNEWWDALVAIFGYQPATKDERNKWGKVVKDLKDAHATAEDIHRAKANHDAALASGAINWKLTPTALASHLGELLSETVARAPSDSRPRGGAPARREPPRYVRTPEDDLAKVWGKEYVASLNNGGTNEHGH